MITMFVYFCYIHYNISLAPDGLIVVVVLLVDSTTFQILAMDQLYDLERTIWPSRRTERLERTIKMIHAQLTYFTL